MKKIVAMLFIGLAIYAAALTETDGQQKTVTYAGNIGKERFNTIAELSDGTIVVGGVADDLNWIPAGITKTQIAATGINNANGTNKIGFLLHLTANLQTVLRVVHFPVNAVEEINFIKTTNAPGQPTGQMYISGKTLDSRANGGGYFIAKLNNNFVGGAPSGITWAKNIWATGDHQTFQPWDVGGDGKVVYATGEPFGGNWAAVYRFKADGTDDVVENWRYHIGTLNSTGANVEGGWTPAASRTDVTVRQSAIVFKVGGRCDLRSWTQADYTAVIPDGNGFTKQGKYPLDLFYNSPCDPAAPTSNGPGYTGYRTGTNPTQRIGGITVDRRSNHFYIGFSIQSRLPDGNPDFEPAVIGMTDTGMMKWWSRLYRETTSNSTPDQYVDGMAIDYSRPVDAAEVAVLARSHGNNVINLWGGNSISATQNPNNPGGSFHNTFTGTNGNIHISWLGKLKAADGVLMYATYNAEYVDGATNFGSPYTEPIHDGWANHNGGWADLNTTRCKTDVKVDLSGRVYLTCVGRRTITTSNAHQKMLKYGQGSSTWNSYIRVYEPNLKTLAYSSLITGTWDAANGAGGDNTDILGVFPTNAGVFAVGYHKLDTATNTAKGNPIPTASVPAWGANAPNGESAILARLPFAAAAPRNINRTTDFDGDGKADVSVFRPSSGVWHLQQSTAGYKGVLFGQNGDKLVPEDYDGDGKTDIAVVRNGVWYILNSGNNSVRSLAFGFSTDTPAPADFDGDNKADIAVFRASAGAWYYTRSSDNNFIAVNFGANGDIPAPADFDGDNKADVAVFRPTTGGWYIQQSSNNNFRGVAFGASGDKPVAGDYDGDGKADIAVFREGNWYSLLSASNSFRGVAFGASADRPTPGDYDGDGKYDAAVYRVGNWYILNSANNSFRSQAFGATEDLPIASAYIP